MDGLIMLREYLDEILDGKKTYDARAYDTKKHGTIPLVDTKRSSIIGLVDLVSTHKISAQEYCKWHATGKWKGLVFDVEDINVTYYTYDFENPRRLAAPIKIKKTGKVWTRIDDDNEFCFQERLF